MCACNVPQLAGVSGLHGGWWVQATQSQVQSSDLTIQLERLIFKSMFNFGSTDLPPIPTSEASERFFFSTEEVLEEEHH